VVVAFIDNNKKKSNSYWQKIKDALNKINTKIMANEKDIIDINLKLEEFQKARLKDRETITELQNSKNVVKNLVQLKKSVENIYGNYQTVLSLQKGLKQRLEDQSGDSLWHESDFFRQKKSSVFPEEIIGLDYSKDEG
jgi:DNA repair ATPase RecN